MGAASATASVVATTPTATTDLPKRRKKPKWRNKLNSSADFGAASAAASVVVGAASADFGAVSATASVTATTPTATATKAKEKPYTNRKRQNDGYLLNGKSTIDKGGTSSSKGYSCMREHYRNLVV